MCTLDLGGVLIEESHASAIPISAPETLHQLMIRAMEGESISCDSQHRE